MKPLDGNLAAWGLLVAAGLLEVGFTSGLALANLGQRWGWTLFGVCVVGSFALLQEAAKTIPLGVAYAVWTGIGAAGTLIVSAAVFKAPISPLQYGFVVLLIFAVAGLKLAEPR